MFAKVQKWGNSLALRIPAKYARDLQLSKGSFVEVSFEDGKLSVVPVVLPTWTLEELLSGVNENNLHGEMDF